jgi:predicted transcriptional regulator
MTPATIRPVAIKIDGDTEARVKRFADARQRTSHWLMRGAITQYVEREEKRETFRRNTLKAWDDYRTTGLHVSADEADAWVAQIEPSRVPTSSRPNVTSNLVKTSASRCAAE